MSELQKIKIDNTEYNIIDSIQNLRAEDSFIFRQNKLSLYKGNGEARKYVGSYLGQNGKRLIDFFNYNKWGNTKENGKRIYPIIQENCFFSKTNLKKYLSDAKIEYQKQEQVYHNDIAGDFDKHFKKVNELTDNLVKFSIYDVSDFIDDKKQSRAYIRSDDKIWDTWRKLILPNISYLSILKLSPVDKNKENIIFYFRILLDYQFRSIVHPKLSLEVADEKAKKEKELSKKSKSRDGAQKYRKQVIDYMPQCPFTKISDERLLIASHIKPYAVCISENNQKEASDYLNGLALSPTYDKLFDQGYITFLDNGELICGTQLTPYTWEKLSINPNAKNKMRIYPEDRKKYLKYHRDNVFQDDINDLLL